MLAKANRVTRGADYKLVVRRGLRFTAPHTITYLRRHSASSQVRFGFIVGKSVGTAVVRNRVRRRLKAVCHDALQRVAPGTDVVIRALPGCGDAQWITLQQEVTRALDKVGIR